MRASPSGSDGVQRIFGGHRCENGFPVSDGNAAVISIRLCRNTRENAGPVREPWIGCVLSPVMETVQLGMSSCQLAIGTEEMRVMILSIFEEFPGCSFLPVERLSPPRSHP